MQSMKSRRNSRIGVVGTGFIGRGLIRQILNREDFILSRVLTRRDVDHVSLPCHRELITNSLHEFLEHSDLVVECSGDVRHATRVVNEAFDASLPVLTMNSEFQVTTGSWFVERGRLCEAEGDQPGCLAALDAEVREMGFKPIVYGNMKRFLNRNPTPTEMEYWAQRQGISIGQVTAFTDGTKIQIEQALVANGLKEKIAQMGLLGVENESFRGGVEHLMDAAIRSGDVISDYVLSRNNPSGVFIVATHDAEERDSLEYLKLGEGPEYLLTRDFHLCHLEICKSIKKFLKEDAPLFNNSASPTVGVVAIPKKKLTRGTMISRGIGGNDFYGLACEIDQMTDSVPIGLLDEATLIRDVEPGVPLSWDSVECPSSLARDIWFKILERANDSESILKFPEENLATMPHIQAKKAS